MEIPVIALLLFSTLAKAQQWTPAPTPAPGAACPQGTYQCPSSLGSLFADICCANGQTCALDNNNNPACCPQGAVCTGTAPSYPNPTNSVSYVPNSYFSFPYAPANYPNSASCAAAVAACRTNYDVCTANLGGGALGVTIAVPGGGGVTVVPPGGYRSLGVEATAVCSSLSTAACSGLTATPCERYGKGNGAGGADVSYRGGVAVFVGAGIVALLLG